MAEENDTNPQSTEESAMPNNDNPPSSEASETEGVLDQGDIDALLGGDEVVEDNRQYGSVVERIIGESASSYDRLPMLDIVFDRLVMMMTASLKRVTTANSDISVKEIEPMRFNRAMNNISLPGLIAVVTADPWGGQFVLALDAPLIYASIEMMLGGRKSGPSKAEGRTFTSIERKLTENLMKTVLNDMEESFAPLCEVKFSIDRIEINPQFAAVAQANSPAMHAVFNSKLDDRPGRIEVVMPYGTVDPIREILQKVFFGEKLGGDPVWNYHLKEEIKASKVILETCLKEFEEKLGNVMKWKEGEILDIHVPLDHKANITCENIPLFSGTMGKRNGNVAMKVETDLGGKKEMIDVVSRK